MDDAEEGGSPRKLTQSQRVGLLERDVRAHSRTLTEIITTLQHVGEQIEGLKEWQVTRQIAEAREDERDKSLYDRLTRIEQSIETGIASVSTEESKSIASVNAEVGKIKGFGSRIFWIAMGTLIPAVVLGVAIMLVFGIKIIPTGVSP